MPEIRVTTSADLKGFQQVEDSVNRLLPKFKQLSDYAKTVTPGASTGVQAQPTNLAVGGAINPGLGATYHAPQRVGQRGTPMMGQAYNLSTPTGVVQYYENVLSQAAPMLSGMSRNNASKIMGVNYQPYQVQKQTYNPSSQQMKDWFAGLGKQLSQMSDQMKLDYLGALDSAGRSSAMLPNSIKQFAREYGNQLGAPASVVTYSRVGQSFGSRLGQHFVNNMRGGSGFTGALGAGIKGAIGGTFIDAATGSSAAGSMGAGALGDLAGGPIGAIAAISIQQIAKWIGGQISNGLQAYSDSASSFSQFGHSLDILGNSVKSASTAVENFRSSTVKAGATVGMNASQSTQAAAMMIQAYGGRVGTTGIKNLTQQVGTLALHSGLSSSEAAQIDALGATLGITSGVGQSMNNLGFNQMLENATARAGMQGRQGSFYTGLMGVYSGIQSQSPIISNAAGVAGQYTALNRSGIQGLQGQNATNIMNTMNSSLSGQGLGQMMGMAAIYQGSKGKITNPWQMESILEQGTSAKVGNGTLGGSIIQMAKQFSGGNQYTEAGIISSSLGISVNQAMALMKTNFANARGISTHGSSYQPNTITDVNNIGKSELAAHASKLGNVQATLKSWGSRLGNVPTGSTLAGSSGTLYSQHPNSAGSFSLSGNESPYSSYVYQFLTSKGLSASAAAGIMGNLQQESSMNPNAPGGGIAQWIGIRNANLKKYAKQHNESSNSIDTQLNYLWKELSSGKFGSITKMDKMTPSQAAQYFEKNFEMAGNPQMNNRMGYANNFYTQFDKGSVQEVKLSQDSVNALANAITERTMTHGGGPTR